ncbi:MAG: hypothetical protein LCH61_12375 [Proteobacteria bacterium]|nr:hypothetical protein [Pseudomonadota bacterium]
MKANPQHVTKPATPLAAIAKRILKDAQSPAATRQYLPTQWPVVGGRGTPLVPFTGWETPEIAGCFENGTRIAVGVLSCPGLFNLARELQIPIFKISTTRDETVGFAQRLKALNADAYGSHRRDSDAWCKDEGFDQWELSALPQDLGLEPSSPVTATPRALSVVLPDGLAPREFDERLNRALANVRLADWATSADGRGHCAALGLDPARFDRFTAYSLGGAEPRLSRAREIFIYKPRLQTARLAMVIERVLLASIRRVSMG